MHDSDKFKTMEESKLSPTVFRSDSDISTDGGDEQIDSGIDSIDLHRSDMARACPLGALEDIDEDQEKHNLGSIDLNKALSAMNIDGESPTPAKDKDSGVYMSFVSNNSEELGQFISNSVDDFVTLDDSCKRSFMEVEGGDALTPEHVTPEQIKDFVATDDNGDSLLNVCIINHRTEESLTLINMAPDYDWLNIPNTTWQTPLHLAASTGQEDIVRRLICAGANVLMQDHRGNTPLHCACAHGYEQVVRHFLVPVHYEETRQNRYKIPFQRLPQCSGVRNYEGDTCLHIAAKSRNLTIMRMLLEAGADPNVGEGKAGRTVLHLAAESGDEAMVRMLIGKRKVDLNALDYARRTPARLAYGRVKLGIVALLERHGASVVELSDSSDSDWHEVEMECRYHASG
ncbi:NF-kappa-B inhibitor cactus [Aplysia californica]|uniref:NF-kappa-B inhibitor cactus n=1 Tax=Aplysia californica TaxID=6500 RepID=A0ABM0JT10_APLCA|nr:NF-kappa-B inhibitor cactus [Aplysia californica]